MKRIIDLNGDLKERKQVVVIIETLLYLLIITFTVIGNLCVLLAVYKNVRLRTIPNFFIVILAVSDILLTLTCAPQSIVTTILGRWPFNEYVCQAQGYFVIVMACASLQTLTLTAINRFYRIVRTRHYRRVFTKKKTIIMIGLCFGLACLEPIPYLSSGRRYAFHPGKLFCFQTNEISLPHFIVYLYVGVPTVTLSIFYFLVFKKLRGHHRTVQNNLQLKSEEVSQRDVRVTKILFITVLGFLSCWTPIAIIDFVDTFRGEATFPREVYYLYLLLGNLSGCINPIVYGLQNKKFRDEYKNLCFCTTRRQRIVNVQINPQLSHL